MKKWGIFVGVFVLSAIVASAQSATSYTVTEDFDAGYLLGGMPRVVLSVRRITTPTEKKYLLLLVKEETKRAPERKGAMSYEDVELMRDTLLSMEQNIPSKSNYWVISQKIGKVNFGVLPEGTDVIWFMELDTQFKDSVIYFRNITEFVPWLDLALEKMQEIMKE